MTLEEATKLQKQASALSSDLYRCFMKAALPKVRNDPWTSGTSDTERLHRLFNLAESRLQRRRNICADIKWPHRYQ